MKLKTIKLHNFRAMEDLKIDLNDRLNLFIGINGSGKSTILDAAAISLSWLINRIQRKKNVGRSFNDLDIHNDHHEANIKIDLSYKKKDYSWSIAKSNIISSKKVKKPEQVGLNNLTDQLNKKFIDNSNLPILAYYSINRMIGFVSPEISIHNNNSTIIDLYDSAMNAKTNFKGFFEWFRIQDDIKNEVFTNNYHDWTSQNIDWISKNTIDLLKKVGKCFNKSTGNNGNDYSDLLRLDYWSNKNNYLYYDPKSIFKELIRLFYRTDHFQKFSVSEQKFLEIIDEIEYFTFKLSNIEKHMETDIADQLNKTIEYLFKTFERYDFIKILNNEFNDFYWELINYSFYIGLWWLNNTKITEILRFFNKYKNNVKFQEILNYKSEFISSIKNIIISGKHFDNLYDININRIGYIRNAIEKFLPDFTNLHVSRIPKPHITIKKNGRTFDLNQLSDGEKNLIALVGDVARRLVMANPNDNDPLNGSGIVLIDEIDLHLHPQWQRIVVSKLIETFPNCQFLISTHSPQVIGEVKHENVRILYMNEENEVDYFIPDQSLGLDSSEVLQFLMQTNVRNKIISDKLNDIFVSIDKEDYTNATNLIKSLKNDVNGSIAEITRAESIINMLSDGFIEEK